MQNGILWAVGGTGLTFLLTSLGAAAVFLFRRAVAEKLQKEGSAVRVVLCEYLAPYDKLADEVIPHLAGEQVILYEEEIKTGGFAVNLSAALAARGALDGKRSRIVAAGSAFATPRAGETVWQSAGVDEAALFDAAKELVFGGK